MQPARARGWVAAQALTTNRGGTVTGTITKWGWGLGTAGTRGPPLVKGQRGVPDVGLKAGAPRTVAATGRGGWEEHAGGGGAGAAAQPGNTSSSTRFGTKDSGR